MKINKTVVIGLVLLSGIVSAIVVNTIMFEVKAQGSTPTVGHIVLYEAGSTSGGSPTNTIGEVSYSASGSYVWRGTKSFVENIFLPETNCDLRVKCCYTVLESHCEHERCNGIIDGSPGACFDGTSTNLGDYEYKIDCTTEHAELNHVSISYKC